MCGIAGIVGAGALVNLDMAAMMDSLAHRGPDGWGWASFGETVSLRKGVTHQERPRQGPDAWALLGHRRLAVLDVSERGLQPMSDNSGRWWVVFNGEIYNYIELKKELIALGHIFKTNSDTEVLLEALAEYGIGALKTFDGMFAFAAIDLLRKKVYLARDRFGEKPLYYSVVPGGMAFSSELQSILAGGIDRKIDMASAANFLVHGEIMPDSGCFIANVRQVRQGSYIEIDADVVTRLEEKQWYDLKPASREWKNENEIAEILETLLTNSVKSRLRSDVPVGTCLSGGLDSSSVVAIAKLLLGEEKEFHAFTSVPDYEKDSELSWAEKVAASCHITLHRVNVDANGLREDLLDLARTQGEPFSTLGMYCQYKVFQAARRNGVVVMLDGQGGDEVLLGYSRAFGVIIYNYLTRGKVIDASSLAWGARNNSTISPIEMAKCLGQVNGLTRGAVHRMRSKMLSEETLKISKTSREVGIGSDPERFRREQFTKSPLPALLRYEDRNAMHFAVETRLPYLNNQLVEFALSIPVDLLLKKGWTKWPLRKVAEKYLPHDVAWRKDKMGFNAPTGMWMSEIKDIMRDFLHSGVVRFLAKSKYMEGIVNGNYEELQSFRVISLGLWMEALNIFF